jgi:hypothetical protein
MRNPITRKKPPTPWGEKPKIKGFGTTETPFNEKVVDQLNLITGVSVVHIGGGMFNSGKPDIMGLAWSNYLALENKFVKGFSKKLDDTLVVQPSTYRSGQIDFLRGAIEAKNEYLEFWMESGEEPYMGEPIIGSLIGVLSNPRIILAVNAEWILEDGNITAGNLRECLALATEHSTPFVRYIASDCHPEVHDTLGDLVRNI